jgi:hypothetical protein
MPKPKTDPETGELTIELAGPERKSMARTADFLSQIAFLLNSEAHEVAADVIRRMLKGESPSEP